MREDQTIYQRAAGAALAGFFSQLALVVLVALLGLYAQSAAIHAVTWYMLGGLGVWIILWLVYNQHKLERIESMEVEQLSKTDASAAAIFDEAGDQLALARKRLDNLYKYGLNIVSILLGSYLALFGGILLYLNYQTLMASEVIDKIVSGTRFLEDIAVSSQHAWLDGLGVRPAASVGIVLIVVIVLAFVCFLLSRYVAGMTRQDQWQMLRAGAGYLMGSAAALILLALAALASMLGYPLAFGFVALLIPLLMLVLGIEMLLGFVFGLYRPRKHGEMPRPAFDSRITGWLSSPESLGKIVSETLNYQFGLEISSSWFYRLLGRVFGVLVLFGAGVLVLLSSLVIVGPQQQAVITRFGDFRGVVESGLHLKWPWPLGKAEKYDVYLIQQVVVGSDMGGLRDDTPLLWTNQHASDSEEYLVTAPTPLPPGERLTADIPAAGLAGGHVTVQYRIADLSKYVRSASNPRQMIIDVAMRRMNMFFVTHDIDSLLTAGRVEMADYLQEYLQSDLDAMDMGVEMTAAVLTSIHPPQEQEVASHFHETIDADQERESMIEEARRRANQILAEVAGSREQALAISQAIDGLQPLRDQVQQMYRTQAQGQAVDDALIASLEQRINEQEVALQELLDQVGGEAASRIHQARADRWRTAVQARAQAASFEARLQAYNAAPMYYRNRLYLDTLSEGLKDRRKIIMATDAKTPPTLQVDMKRMERGLGLIGADSQ